MNYIICRFIVMNCWSVKICIPSHHWSLIRYRVATEHVSAKGRLNSKTMSSWPLLFFNLTKWRTGSWLVLTPRGSLFIFLTFLNIAYWYVSIWITKHNIGTSKIDEYSFLSVELKYYVPVIVKEQYVTTPTQACAF